VDFDFSPQQYEFQETVRSFLDEKYDLANVSALLKGDGFDAGVWSKLTELGVFAMLAPEEYGGLGLTYVDLALVLEEFGRALVPAPIAETIVAGDVITIAGVNAVNRTNYQTLGTLAQFVVTAAAAAAATSITIYPAIIPPASSVPYAGLPYTPQQYQTVTASPANNATITPFLNASTSYRENLAYVPDAITMVVAPLWIPPNEKGVIAAARHEYDRLSMRSLVSYEPSTDQPVDRLDILFGSGVPRPEWIVQCADVVP